MKDEHIMKITFKERFGQYEYSVISFDVSNDPGVFKGCMNRIFYPYLDQFVVVLIDDILVYSESDEDDVGHFRIVLQVL